MLMGGFSVILTQPRPREDLMVTGTWVRSVLIPGDNRRIRLRIGIMRSRRKPSRLITGRPARRRSQERLVSPLVRLSITFGRALGDRHTDI